MLLGLVSSSPYSDLALSLVESGLSCCSVSLFLPDLHFGCPEIPNKKEKEL